MGIESPVHLLFIAVVALVVLGPKRLPGLAKALGQGIREFRQSLDIGASTDESAPPAASAVSAPSASSATPAPAPTPDATDATVAPAVASHRHATDASAAASAPSAGEHRGEQ
jgi:TatA/E family protein of Tat protein translocase